ncbi:MAG: 23S rRNA (uracil(1939)-C(5))-methyltransferase RlmD [Eubacteriales bacterium]|nr:23S rRNA (uracil(1939)-C(5))-methyltransferase RlmD [Eubacteriales bacterium]
MINKNDQFEIYITDLSDEGAGIGKTDGFTWFVKDAVIGDHILAAATKVKKNYGFARLVKVIEPSASRTTPACPLARSCGGCQLQQLEYDSQLKFKESKVLNDLKRIGGFTDAGAFFEPIIGMQQPFRYRNKAVYPIGRNKEGRIIAGFYAGRTHSIIACEDCLLGFEENRIVLSTIIKFMGDNDIEPYNENTGSGVVRHVLIRKGLHTGELMVCIVINAGKLKNADVLCGRLREMLPSLKSFTLSVNRERTNVIMGTRIINVYGPGYIEDLIHDRDGSQVRFRISPLSFFQVNSEQMEKLYGTALEFAGLTGNERVWDLYCGVGTISLFLARHAKKVYGVEIIPEAIDNARENAELNSIDNAEFFVGKAEEVLPEWYSKEYRKTGEKIDVIVVDPPRKGCDENCLKTMVSIAPKRIVYVSCDPATLARDLKYLCSEGYRIETVRPVDMFPQTVHVETVCLLSKLKSTQHIEVELDMDELDLTDAEKKATYQEIKDYVLEHTGLKVSSLYIAQVKQKCGIIERENYNKPKSEDAKQPQCPPDKEKAIKEALKHFGMI